MNETSDACHQYDSSAERNANRSSENKCVAEQQQATMSNNKKFDLPPKCPGMLSTKISGLFGWRHTYRVHHLQKGINHYPENLQKSYSLNLPPPKRTCEKRASHPSLRDASSMVIAKKEYKRIYELKCVSV